MRRMARRGEMQESISILSTGLIERGLSLLQRDAFPVYQINRDRRGPPFAQGENLPSAIALLLLSSGLDYHLARLKWLRDLTEHKPPLSVPTYFNRGRLALNKSQEAISQAKRAKALQGAN